MAYSVLEALVTANTSPAHKSLDKVEQRLKRIADSTYRVTIDINEQTFGHTVSAVKELKKHLGDISGVSIPLVVDARGVEGSRGKLNDLRDDIKKTKKQAEDTGSELDKLLFESHQKEREFQNRKHAQALAMNSKFDDDRLKSVVASVVKQGKAEADQFDKARSEIAMKRVAETRQILQESTKRTEIQRKADDDRLKSITASVFKQGKLEADQFDRARSQIAMKRTAETREILQENTKRLEAQRKADEQRIKDITASIVKRGRLEANQFDKARSELAMERTRETQRVLRENMERTKLEAARQRETGRIGTPGVGLGRAEKLGLVDAKTVDQINAIEKSMRRAAVGTKEYADAIDRAKRLSRDLYVQSRGAGAGGVLAERMNKAAESAELFEKRVGGLKQAFSQLTNTVRRWLIGYLAVSGLIQAFGALRYAVVGYNSMLETSRITFSVLMGTSEKVADRFLGKLREFARLTPFEFKDLVPLTQKLVALGVVARSEVEQKTIPILESLGNAAAALSGGEQSPAMVMDRISRALGQMIAKGKASAEEVTQQLGELVPAAEYIAKAMNVTVAEVFDLMEKGMVDGKKAADAIIAGIAHDTRFDEMMKRRMKTYEGAMSNIKDAATEVVANGFAPFFESLSKTAQHIGKIANTHAFQEWAERTLSAFAKMMMGLGNVIKTLFEIVNDKMPYIVAILSALGAAKMVTGILNVTKAIIALNIGTSTSAQTALVRMLALYGAIILFVAAYRKFPSVREGFGFVVFSLIKIVQGLSNVIYTLLEAVAAVPKALLAMPTALLDKVAPYLGDFGKALIDNKGKVEEFLDAINPAKLREQGNKFFNEAAEWWAGTGMDGVESFMTQGLFGSLGIREALEAAERELDAARERESNKPPLVNFGPTAGDGMDKAMKKMLQRMKAALEELSSQFEKFGGLADSLIEKIRGFGDRSEKSATQFELMKDAFSGIDAPSKRAAINLAGIVDKMKAITDLRDKTVDSMQAMEKRLVAIGADTSPFYRNLKILEDFMGSEGKLRDLFNQGQQNFGDIRAQVNATIYTIKAKVLEVDNLITKNSAKETDAATGTLYRGAPGGINRGGSPRDRAGGMIAPMAVGSLPVVGVDKSVIAAERKKFMDELARLQAPEFAKSFRFYSQSANLKNLQETPYNEFQRSEADFLGSVEGNKALHRYVAALGYSGKQAEEAVRLIRAIRMVNAEYADYQVTLKKIHDAVEENVRTQDQEGMMAAERSKWLMQNKFDAVEFAAAMERAKIEIDALFNRDFDQLSGKDRAGRVSDLMGAAETAARQKELASALEEHAKKVKQLDDDYSKQVLTVEKLNGGYGSLVMTSRELAIRNNVLEDSTKRLLSAEQKELEIAKEIRSERYHQAQILVGGLISSMNEAASSAGEMWNQIFAGGAKSRIDALGNQMFGGMGSGMISSIGSTFRSLDTQYKRNEAVRPYKERAEGRLAELESQRESLEVSSRLSELDQQRAKWAKEDGKRNLEKIPLVQEELDLREKITAEIQKINDIQFRHTMEDMEATIESLKYQEGVAREMFEAWRALQKNPNLTDAQRGSIFDAQKQVILAREQQSIWSDAFRVIADGAGRMSDGINGAFASIADGLYRLAQQFITNKIFEYLMQAAGFGSTTFTGGFNGNAGVPAGGGYNPYASGHYNGLTGVGAGSVASAAMNYSGVAGRGAGSMGGMTVGSQAITINFPGVRTAQDAQGVGGEVTRQLGSVDSRRTQAQAQYGVTVYGAKNQ